MVHCGIFLPVDVVVRHDQHLAQASAHHSSQPQEVASQASEWEPEPKFLYTHKSSSPLPPQPFSSVSFILWFSPSFSSPTDPICSTPCSSVPSDVVVLHPHLCSFQCLLAFLCPWHSGSLYSVLPGLLWSPPPPNGGAVSLPRTCHWHQC